MPSAATARAKAPPLTRKEAIDFVTSVPFLVAGSHQKLLRSMYTDAQYNHCPKIYRVFIDKPIIEVEFEVSIGSRSYKFDSQPFRVMRQITEQQYRSVLPNGAKFKFYYEISTD